MNAKKLLKYFIFFVIIICGLYFAYQLIYPTMICKGQLNKVRIWTDSSNKSITKLLDDEHTEANWSLLIRRDALTINDDRFPLYKERSYNNNFAKKTTSGYEGSSSTDYLQHVKYRFSYNQISNQLAVELTGNGDHILDGYVGKDDLKASFLGVCQRKWF